MLNLEKAKMILINADYGYFEWENPSIDLQITTSDKLSFCEIDKDVRVANMEGFFDLKDLKVLVKIFEECWEEDK